MTGRDRPVTRPRGRGCVWPGRPGPVPRGLLVAAGVAAVLVAVVQGGRGAGLARPSNNSRKHALGARVAVRLAADGDRLHFAVVDDGPSLTPWTATRGGGCATWPPGSPRSAGGSTSARHRAAAPRSRARCRCPHPLPPPLPAGRPRPLRRWARAVGPGADAGACGPGPAPRHPTGRVPARPRPGPRRPVPDRRRWPARPRGNRPGRRAGCRRPAVRRPPGGPGGPGGAGRRLGPRRRRHRARGPRPPRRGAPEPGARRRTGPRDRPPAPRWRASRCATSSTRSAPPRGRSPSLTSSTP